MAEGGQDHTDANWERSVLEKVALAAIAEQRATRRWGMAFKML
ncbi:MAG: S49 family peptidase, partial [Betaproteobacteria bacterium]|nr:S49 family peptidase [Betaproteobacteria bacterium]